MSQRILVLGADGFIGRRVVAALARSDWACPVAVGRRERPAAPGVTRLCCDATDESALARALADADGVVNCVASAPETMVRGAEILFRAALARAPAIVHFSSMAVYGSAEGDLDESAPLSGDVGAYAAAKVETERHAARYPNAVVLRPGCVYGPGSQQWSGRIARWLLARRIGDLGAGGDGCANLVHVADVATATLEALRRPETRGRAYNLAMADAPDWNEYFFRFAKALGAVPVARRSERRMALEAKLIAPPLKIAEVLARRLGMRVGGLPEPIPPSLLRLWRQDIRLISRRAERDLGLGWTDLGRGLAETADWVRNGLPQLF